ADDKSLYVISLFIAQNILTKLQKFLLKTDVFLLKNLSVDSSIENVLFCTVRVQKQSFNG
ncbi:MAG TPA: hypothetical protein VLZ72_03315, partial [Flavobacterium sp.]|nr:hypothetical protein [Flavobacterium sp.]